MSSLLFVKLLWHILFNFSLIVTFQKRFAARNIVFLSFGQFFPILDGKNWEKTGLSQFIPFWTGKTGFGREKPNPVPNWWHSHLNSTLLTSVSYSCFTPHIDGLVEERCNYVSLALIHQYIPLTCCLWQGWGEYYSGSRLVQNDNHEYTKNIVLEYYSSTDFPVLVLVCSVLVPALVSGL